MASYKTVNGDYQLNCINYYANGQPISDSLGTFTINANLIVLGDTINTNPQVQSEPFITVAANNTGVLKSMGLIGQTSNTTFAGLRFNSIDNAWQVSGNVYANGAPVPGNSYVTIATGNIQVAGSDQQIQFNNGGDFGGAANLRYAITGGYETGNTSVLTVSGLEKFTQIGAAQANINFATGASYLFSNPVQSGGTGLYFVSPNPTDPGLGVTDELISKSKAIVYSIIF